MLLACLLSIASRPAGYSAAVWLTNALLIGLLLRNPGLARRPLTWLLAFAAYCAADRLTGSSWPVTLGMNASNMLGVATGWWLLQGPGRGVLGFTHQRALLIFIAGSSAAALASALPGALVSQWMFATPAWQNFVMWLSSELYNLLLLLPPMLAAPRGWPWQWPWRQLFAAMPSRSAAPLLALLASEMLATLIGGPGMLGFSVPALIWCAMAYGIFPTTLLNLLLCTWKTAVVALGALHFGLDQWVAVTSFRIGIALLTLAPLAVAIIDRMRSQALQQLQQAVDYDDLTGALSRRTLLQRSHRQLRRISREGASVAILLLDLDHFKQINDRHGHAQGDAVLRAFAALVRAQLRPDDLFGRTGGEEFVLFLPRTTDTQALQVIDRLRAQLRAHPLALPSGASLHITFSAGLRSAAPPLPEEHLEQLLSQADAALYQAKAAGRDQVCCFQLAMD